MLRAISMILTRLLSERGDISTMRVMSLWSLLIASIIALYSVFHCHDSYKHVEVIAIFLGAAFTGKVAHKFAERKNEKTK